MTNKSGPKTNPGTIKKNRRPETAGSNHAGLTDRLQTHVYNTFSEAGYLNKTLLLAFSGGLDSTVLLHLLASIKPRSGFVLHAMHVHHGLSPNADSWADFCSTTCSALGIPLQIAHVQVEKASGDGIEAAARTARYQALLDNAADYVVLAHHEDDQAETLLLQLLRGAGVKGLAAMGAIDLNKRLLRPLLNISRAELKAYADHHRLQWIEDESNADISYDRNYCRQEIFPVMLKRFPAATSTLARSALHMAEAAQLLDTLAALDAEQHTCGNQLRISGLAGLPEPRARNLLRWWLSANRQRALSAARLQEMLSQLLSAKTDAGIKLMLGDAIVRRYRDFAYLEQDSTAVPLAMLWQGEDEMQLPDGSRLIFERKLGAGLAFQRLGISKLRISNRLGGERFKPELERPTRTLKHLLQEAGMPPWLRERLPLIYCEDALAVVPGIGVACNLQTRPDESGLVIVWQQAD